MIEKIRENRNRLMVIFSLIMSVVLLFVASIYETSLVFEELSRVEYINQIFLSKIFEVLLFGFWIGIISKIISDEEKKKREQIEDKFKEQQVKFANLRVESENLQLQIVKEKFKKMNLKQDYLGDKIDEVLLRSNYESLREESSKLKNELEDLQEES